jgi:hypothetical protein
MKHIIVFFKYIFTTGPKNQVGSIDPVTDKVIW